MAITPTNERTHTNKVTNIPCFSKNDLFYFRTVGNISQRKTKHQQATTTTKN